MADCLLDTNVLFYAAMGSFDAPEKHVRARALISETDFGLSAQVLQEFIAATTRKTARPLSLAEAARWLEALIDRPCVAVDRELVAEAARLAERHRINYWDGAILAAAERIGAAVVYTEDLSDGQAYGPVRVVNPFRFH